MSISGLFYIIGGQFLLGRMLQLVPISGYLEGIDAIKFLLLPVLVGVFAGLGASTRWYRTIFLEEMGKEYVRAARARGVGEIRILYCHNIEKWIDPYPDWCRCYFTGAVHRQSDYRVLFCYPWFRQLYH